MPATALGMEGMASPVEKQSTIGSADAAPEREAGSGQDASAAGARTRELEAINRELGARNAELLDALTRAHAAIRAKALFIANMSHELRTPLNAVIGFAELIERELHGPIGDRRYVDYAGDIRESGMHLLRIVNDILDLSKAEAGRMELSESVVDVASLVAGACRLVRQRCEEANVRLLTEVSSPLPLLYCDEHKLKQMLINLLSNAMKFTGPGGQILVSAGRGAGGCLRIAVRDTGIGIAPEHLERVLEPFAQVESPLARGREGTGLGLPLVKRMIERHGGTFDLVSAIGEGTVATLEFPAERVLGG